MGINWIEGGPRTWDLPFKKTTDNLSFQIMLQMKSFVEFKEELNQ